MWQPAPATSIFCIFFTACYPYLYLVLFHSYCGSDRATPSGSSVGISKRLFTPFEYPPTPVDHHLQLFACVYVWERQNQDGSKHGSKAHLSVCYHHKCCHHHHHHHYSEQSSTTEARYVIYDCFSDRHFIRVMITTPLEGAYWFCSHDLRGAMTQN